MLYTILCLSHSNDKACILKFSNLKPILCEKCIFFVLIVTLKFASEGRDCKDDLVQCRHYSCKYCELSVFQELPTTACHLLVEIVKELFVLDYLRVHSLNHGQFQINCATISSTTCFSSSWLVFRWKYLRIQVESHLFR